jgi:hypothetical protein
LAKALVLGFVAFGVIQEAQGAPQTAHWLNQVGATHSRALAMVLTAAIAIALLVLAFPHRVGVLFGHTTGPLKDDRPSPSPTTFPDVEFEIRGSGFKTVSEDMGGIEIARLVLPLKDVRMTNHELQRRVSLTFHAKLPLSGIAGLDEIALFPRTTMPIDLAPQTSHTQDIEFDRGLIPRGAEQVDQMLIEVEDHLSGLRTAIPTMGKWRPAKDGKWTGVFPAPMADLDVVIEREEWDSFQHEAFILELKVRITNHTGRTKRVTGYALLTDGRESPPVIPTIEAHREVERRRNSHQRLDGQSTIEAGEHVVGWLVFPLPWSGDPGPTGYTLTVHDELNQDYAAKVAGPAR